MGITAIAFLLVTFLLAATYGWIVFRTYRPREKNRLEEPKYTMLSDTEN